MSIWATFFHLDDDKAPIGYHGSHLFPSPLLRAGSVDLALIPGFINPDGPDFDDEDDRAPHPLLRLSVNAETVVLDQTQAREAFVALGDWLMRTADVLPASTGLPDSRAETTQSHDKPARKRRIDRD